MKYYFPTTTLNFDNILSSQLISPAGMYRSDTLWWNRFESVVGQRNDSIVLYNRIPTWTIKDSDRDDYPLVVEIDKSFLEGQIQEYAIGKKSKALVVTTSIPFSALELEQGKIRFLFRNAEEKERMLIKTITSAAECKIVKSILYDFPGVFSIIHNGVRINLQSAVDELAGVLEGTPDVKAKEYPCELIKEERERGAELGYQVGRYAKSLRSGSFMDAFRVPLSYADWRSKILPEPFAAILNNLCSRPIQKWDPNRVAVVDFCQKRWEDCFKGKKMVGKKVQEGTSLHESILAIKRHLENPEEKYRIAEEKDPYMQAFAAFLRCGDESKEYPRFARNPLIREPEYLLALYGALVGYTFFSRSLLENKIYLPQTPPVVHERQTARVMPCQRERVNEGEKSQTAKERFSGVMQQESGGSGDMGAGKENNISNGAKKTIVQGEFNLADANQPKCRSEIDKVILVRDESLCDEVVKAFVEMGDDRVRNLTDKIQKFCGKYLNGYYGNNPEQYAPKNPDLIDHLLCCFASEKRLYCKL